MFLSCLHLEKYEEIIDLSDEIEISENFLDYDEKNLKKLYLFGREKLKNINYDKYVDHLKLVKKRRMAKIDKNSNL